jgi:hypothetical protein
MNLPINKNQFQFFIGIAVIVSIVAIGPFLRKQLLPTAFNEMVDEKEIDVSSLFYTESENAGKAAYKMSKRPKQ